MVLWQTAVSIVGRHISTIFIEIWLKDIILLSRALKEVFKNLFTRGFSHYNRQLRNDILVITTFIAQNPGAPMIVSMNQIAS